MKRFCQLTFVSIAVLLIFALAQSAAQSFRPKAGFVPDEKTAVAVARSILVGIYGEKQVSAEEPLSASLSAGVWTVRGTSHMPNGGVAEIALSKATARVIHVTHGK